MKKYENYKDSGLEWLGMVPEHWKIDKLKYQFGLVTTPSESSNKIGLENIESATGRFIKTDSDFEGNGIAFLPNDIVYGKLRPYLQKVWLAEFSGSAVGDFYVFRCNKGTYPVYVKYLLLSHNFTVEADGFTYGAKMPRVSYEFVANLKWAMPPLIEQRAIASYLDHKVGQIDALISEKEKMVEDLKAYRSSLITETVTKGLNKEVEMKDSGLEWLGMVPKHWEIVPLKYLLSEPLQYGANESADNCNPLEPRYIRITDITEGGKLRKSTYRTLPYQKAEGYMLKKGDILFARSGATVGKTFIFEEDYDACFAGYLIKASCNERLLPMFLYYFTSSNSYENWKNSIFNQATIQNIGADKYCALPITTPSSEEQKRIISFLSPKVNQIDTSISEIEHQLSDLKSYKSSLITEAVTGKIDLRDWQTKNHNALW